jgi:hypothetical protein
VFVDAKADALVPRFDSVAGKYVWEPAAPVAPAIEPAFVREAIISEFDPDADNVRVRGSSGTLTFADAYPNGPLPSLPDAASAQNDPLADWRLPGEMADDILIALPEGTPKMLRDLLTLLLGGMRHR